MKSLQILGICQQLAHGRCHTHCIPNHLLHLESVEHLHVCLVRLCVHVMGTKQARTAGTVMTVSHDSES
jgi:hypothetical protein